MIDDPIPPINILIIAQTKKQQSIDLAKQAIACLKSQKNLTLFSQDTLLFQNTSPYSQETQVNYIISIGQNCTMMRALRLLDNKNHTIPIISISDGDQPIMASYSHCQVYNVLNNFVTGIKENNLRIMNTLRFDVFGRTKNENEEKFMARKNFSCQLEIHRDMRKSVLKLKIYTRIQGKNFLLLASVWGDGIIISTPLGSLGRNINLSGPIVYKSLQSITIVPISPLSLNFRPIILPATVDLVIQIDSDSRSAGQVFADGEFIANVPQGKQFQIQKSSETSKLVKGLSQKSTQQQWICCLREVLSWGQAFGAEKPKYTSMSSSSSNGSKL